MWIQGGEDLDQVEEGALLRPWPITPMSPDLERGINVEGVAGLESRHPRVTLTLRPGHARSSRPSSMRWSTPSQRENLDINTTPGK